jgi:plastocyanin
MPTLSSRVLSLLILTATGAGCGGGDGGGGIVDPASVLTTLEVTPASAALFTAAPGNTVTLAVVAKDQNGQTMANAGTPSFSSENSAIAEVADDGTVTAKGPGITRITASLTANGVTKTASTTVTAQVAPPNASVTAPAIQYVPPTVDVQQGGAVTWTFGPVPHTVTFTTTGAPQNVGELQDGSAARTFPASGSYHYRCDIHPSMTGLVHVH